MGEKWKLAPEELLQILKTTTLCKILAQIICNNLKNFFANQINFANYC